MRKSLIAVFVLMALLVLCACQNKSAENAPTQGSSTPAQTSEQKPADKPASTSGSTAQQGTSSSPSAPEPVKPTSQQSQTKKGDVTPATPSQSAANRSASTEKVPTAQPGAAAPQQPSAKPTAKAPAGPIILAGAPMGGVRFEHSKHAVACETCHHSPRAPMPPNAPQMACTSCHTKPPRPGMTTGKQAAFHNPTATAGTCIDCHKKSGGAAPTKCTQCHKKENA